MGKQEQERELIVCMPKVIPWFCAAMFGRLIRPIVIGEGVKRG